MHQGVYEEINTVGLFKLSDKYRKTTEDDVVEIDAALNSTKYLNKVDGEAITIEV